MIHLIGAIVRRSVSQLAQSGRQHVADNRRHVRRPDEPPRPGRALRVDRPQEVGGQRAGHDVRRVLAGAHRLGALVLQDGLRRHLHRRRRAANGVQTQTHRGRRGRASTSSRTSSANRAASPTASVNRARRCRRPTPSSRSTSRPSTLAYFQFVFAAITPLLFLGSVLGRIKFSAWCLLVPLWSTFVYGVDAFLLWGGGYFAQEGALDFSGGYVIHMSAGVSGFVAAWVLGPRLLRDRQHALPNNLVMAAVGAGILWLGWNGFNGGDPYYAGAERGRGRHQHQPRHRHRRPGLDGHGRLAHQGEEAHLPGRCQRHDLRPGRHHAVRRLGQRPGRHLRRRHLLAPSSGWPGTTCPRCGRSRRWTTPSVSSTPTASPASSGGMLLGIFGDPNMIEYGCGHLDAGRAGHRHVARRPTPRRTATCVPFGR